MDRGEEHLIERPDKSKVIMSLALKILLGSLLVGFTQSGPIISKQAVVKLLYRTPVLINGAFKYSNMAVSMLCFLGIMVVVASGIKEGINYFKYSKKVEDIPKKNETDNNFESILDSACGIKDGRHEEKERVLTKRELRSSKINNAPELIGGLREIDTKTKDKKDVTSNEEVVCRNKEKRDRGEK